MRAAAPQHDLFSFAVLLEQDKKTSRSQRIAKRDAELIAYVDRMYKNPPKTKIPVRYEYAIEQAARKFNLSISHTANIYRQKPSLRKRYPRREKS